MEARVPVALEMVWWRWRWWRWWRMRAAFRPCGGGASERLNLTPFLLAGPSVCWDVWLAYIEKSKMILVIERRLSIVRRSVARPLCIRRLWVLRGFAVRVSMRRPVVRRRETTDWNAVVWSSPVRRTRMRMITLSRLVTTGVVTMLAMLVVAMMVVSAMKLLVNLTEPTANLVVNGLEDAFHVVAGSNAVYKLGAVPSDSFSLLLNHMFECSQL